MSDSEPGSLALGLSFFFELVKKIIKCECQRKSPPARPPCVTASVWVAVRTPLCFLPGSALKEFEQVPRHLTDELHLFSLEDLVRVKKRLLMPLLKDILKASLAHVASCEVRLPWDRCVPELSLTL